MEGEFHETGVAGSIEAGPPRGAGCEGRCGSELDGAGHECLPYLLPDLHPPRHTPERCRYIRAWRDAVMAALPGWRVGVAPEPSDPAGALTLVALLWTGPSTAHAQNWCMKLPGTPLGVRPELWEQACEFSAQVMASRARTLPRS